MESCNLVSSRTVERVHGLSSGIGRFLCAAGRGQEEIYGDRRLVAVCGVDLSLLGVSLQEEMIRQMVRQTLTLLPHSKGIVTLLSVPIKNLTVGHLWTCTWEWLQSLSFSGRSYQKIEVVNVSLDVVAVV